MDTVTPATDPTPKSSDEALSRITRICEEKKWLYTEYAQVTESLRALGEEFVKFRVEDVFPGIGRYSAVKVATLNAAQSPKTVNRILTDLAQTKVTLAIYNPKTGEMELFA